LGWEGSCNITEWQLIEDRDSERRFSLCRVN